LILNPGWCVVAGDKVKADEGLFRVEEELQQRLRRKYRKFKTKVIESGAGPYKVQIQQSIAKEYLKISEEELRDRFNELCAVFMETCSGHQIPFMSSDILVLTDDGIERGLQIKLRNEKDGSLRSIVFIPPVDLNAPSAFWNYTFLHELGHCWISIKYRDLRTEEIFTDLVAVSALRELIRPHEELFKETVKLRSYIGGKQGKEYFGTEQKKAMKAPETYLKRLLKNLTENTTAP
jgi:hypothetical protein